MKKIFFFTAIAFFSLGSCRKEGTTLAKDQTLAKSQSQTNASSSGGAFTFHGSFTEPREGLEFFNTCTNEKMYIYGDVVVKYHGIYNGTKSSITFHANLPGNIGVGESGRQYTISGSATYHESQFSDGLFTTKLQRMDRAITAGSKNNLIIRESFYIEIDAAGNVTVIRDPVNESYCQ